MKQNKKNKYPSSERIIEGLSLSAGVSFAKVCMFNDNLHTKIPDYKLYGKDQIEYQVAQLDKAKKMAGEELDKIIEEVSLKLGPAEGEIFTAQKLILEDPNITQKVKNLIEQGHKNVEAAIKDVMESYESKLRSMDNEYIRERASDIAEIKKLLLKILTNITPGFQCSGEVHCQRGRNRVVVAEELTPSLTMALDSEHTLGFVTEKGGPASHAAILARALGVPAVSGISEVYSYLYCGTDVLVDGDQGRIIISPSKDTLKQYPQLEHRGKKPFSILEPIPQIKIMANLNLAKDVAIAKKYKSEGIGLYRTEFEFFSAGKVLSEEEQFERYKSVLTRMDGEDVSFRLLDIGGDKTAPFFNLPQEENPYLGYRGGRLLLGSEELFRGQARALARVSTFGPVNVIYPMIIELEQFLTMKDKFNSFTSDIEQTNIKHGVMLEVPSACFGAEELLKYADFASIGSNDLIQYLFAVDRNNNLVAYDFHPNRNVFWNVISHLVKAADSAQIPLSLCGEIAATPRYLKKLISMGIKQVSVSPNYIPRLRNSILKI